MTFNLFLTYYYILQWISTLKISPFNFVFKKIGSSGVEACHYAIIEPLCTNSWLNM